MGTPAATPAPEAPRATPAANPPMPPVGIGNPPLIPIIGQFRNPANAPGKGERPFVGMRGPGVNKGEFEGGKGKFKGIGRGKDKGNRYKSNPNLPQGALGGNSLEFVNVNVLRLAEEELMDDDNQIRALRSVAN